MGKIKYSLELLSPIVKTNTSLKGVLLNLGLEPTNGSRISVLKSIKRYNINTNHFKIDNYCWSRKRKENDEIFIKDSKVGRIVVRNRILKNNLIEYKCQNCGQDENWMGGKMPLILDHINGINNDHRLENLRFLCSNCDSIQPTYKNKNNNLSITKRKIKTNLYLKSKNLEKTTLKNEKIKMWETIIKDSNIDFSKKTWGKHLSEIIGYSPQYCLKFVKENLEYLIS